MDIHDIIGARPWTHGPARPVVGLDLGSRASKGVLLDGNRIFTALIPTGLYMQETADELLEKLLQLADLRRSGLAHIVGTGYGRISLSYRDIDYNVVTEISCHAMGAHSLIPETRTIIDIGGQDSKAIKVDTQNGKVLDFVMNDKCAAGTGRFLEKAAALLGLQLHELGEVALQSKNPAQVSSQCVVFAESEMISLRARGERNHDEQSRADIAAGVHLSAARRVTNLLGRVGLEPALVFTGGVSNNRGMWETLERLLKARFQTVAGIDMIFAGALGAAVHAGREVKPPAAAVPAAGRELRRAILGEIDARIDEAKNEVIAAQAEGRVGYVCVYTPVELLSAAGVRHVRLLKAGTPEVVGAGELHTNSVLCDHTKSCVGGFVTGDPLFKALDRVYNFHACANMKRATEIIGQFVPTKLLNVPKNRGESESRSFFRQEILELKRDLERLTGRAIADEEVSRQILLYNQARSILRRLSELRKRSHPALSGREFADLARGFFYLKPEDLVECYTRVYEQLRSQSGSGPAPLRLLLAGSVMAEGDRRLLEIVEEELGAVVVAEDHCAGLRAFRHSIAEDGDPYQALANGYLDQAPCSNRKPMDDAIRLSAQMAGEYDVDGVLYVYLKFCACYGLTKSAFVARFQELGFPVVDISSDYSQSDRGQLKTRLEAFVEILREKKQSRHDSLVGTS